MRAFNIRLRRASCARLLVRYLSHWSLKMDDPPRLHDFQH